MAPKPKHRTKNSAKRQRILEAAQELFVERGFEGTSMDDVADAAAVSKQTIYSHFGNKEELFAAAIAARCAAGELSAEDFDEALPCREMLLTVGQRFVRLIASPEAVAIYRLAVANAEQHPTIARLFFHAGPLPTLEALTDYLARCHGAKRLLIPEPRVAAGQFLAMVKGEHDMRRILNVEPLDTASVEAYVARCVDVFMAAYGRDAPEGLEAEGARTIPGA
ncbi:MAG: TetR/AcrR family transcriptional regulator [Candidatus Competibacterales bacterium]